MNIADIITANRASTAANVHSRKRALQWLSELLAGGTPYLTASEIFSALIAREKLGSTGIGHGIAIPHARMKGIDECVGAIIRLSSTVDFEADDGQPVDLIFGLLVPEESCRQYSGMLHSLAATFDDPDCRTELRNADSDKALVTTLVKHSSAAEANSD